MGDTAIGSNNRKKPINLSAISILATDLTDFLRIILDVEMPKMNSIAFLKYLMQLRPMPVLMISMLTAEGSQITMQALELGAIDLIQKPGNIQSVMGKFGLETIVKLKSKSLENQKVSVLNVPSKSSNQIIAIGGSTGNLEALHYLLKSIRFIGNESIVVALHLPTGFTTSYAPCLDQIYHFI